MPEVTRLQPKDFTTDLDPIAREAARPLDERLQGGSGHTGRKGGALPEAAEGRAQHRRRVAWGRRPLGFDTWRSSGRLAAGSVWVVVEDQPGEGPPPDQLPLDNGPHALYQPFD